MCVKVIASQSAGDVFETRCVFIFIHHKGRRNNEINKQAEKKKKENLTKLN